jgi:hypothetical protein
VLLLFDWPPWARSGLYTSKLAFEKGVEPSVNFRAELADREPVELAAWVKYRRRPSKSSRSRAFQDL